MIIKIILLLVSISLISCNTSPKYKYYSTGIASWYGKPFHLRKTASGEVFNMYKLTAAHNKIPLGTKVKVTRLSNNKFIIVKINDTGGFKKYNREIDLSYQAAKELGCIKAGLCKVKIEKIIY